MFFNVLLGVTVQRLTAAGFIRAVLAVGLAVTALPVRDAVWGPATQELTPTAAARGGWGSRGLGGYWSKQKVNVETHISCSLLYVFQD